MSCGQPCWNCQEPIPPARHNLSPVKQVFCSDECERAFHAFRELVQISEELGLYEE